MDDRLYCIWLSLAVTPGKDTFKKLIEKFNTAKEIFEAEADDIAVCVGSRAEDFDSICDKTLEEAKRILDCCVSKKIGIVTYFDDSFPRALREIDNPPVLLYYRGVLPDFNSECFISVVGTRRLTDYGRKNAFSIGYDLAKSGAIVVSGMAIGIDGVATAGALAAKGITVAFLGCGINVCYPEGHLTLAKEIVKNGCIMTEFPPDTRPDGKNFPIRNRLIIGVSAATLVIEGGERSGSMITARNAREQGKALYALPGNVDNKTSAVSNTLIKNGAKLITGAYDIIRDYEFVYTGKINPFKLEDKGSVKMFDVLSLYKVQCVTHSDKEFNTPRSKKTAQKVAENVIKDHPESFTETSAVAEPKNETSFAEAGFDKTTMRIYMKIPPNQAVAYSSLCDDEYDMKTVMRAIFQLDLGNFVEMLPGERVKRK